MALFDVPDPPGSPLEKLYVPRKTWAGASQSTWEALLRREGVDAGLASQLARAFVLRSEQQLLDAEANYREIEHWANIHTHPGFAGPGHEFDYSPADPDKDPLIVAWSSDTGQTRVRRIRVDTGATIQTHTHTDFQMSDRRGFFSLNGQWLYLFGTDHVLRRISTTDVSVKEDIGSLGGNFAYINGMQRLPGTDDFITFGDNAGASAWNTLRRWTAGGALVWQDAYPKNIKGLAIATLSGDIFVVTHATASGSDLYRVNPASGAKVGVYNQPSTNDATIVPRALETTFMGELVFLRIGSQVTAVDPSAGVDVWVSPAASAGVMHVAPDHSVMTAMGTSGASSRFLDISDGSDAGTGASGPYAQPQSQGPLVWLPDSVAWFRWSNTDRVASMSHPAGSLSSWTNVLSSTTTNGRWYGWVRT